MRLLRREFLHLLAGAAAASTVSSRLAWQQLSFGGRLLEIIRSCTMGGALSIPPSRVLKSSHHARAVPADARRAQPPKLPRPL